MQHIFKVGTIITGCLDIVISVVISLRPGCRISAEAVVKNTWRKIATPPFMFSRNRDKVTGERGIPHNEELNVL
jgi:hypothetical protein